jgi:pimeloyl-ACP methyl ester carboxylesterase
MKMATPLALLGVTPRMLTWRGHQIALHEQGTGPVVLLVHSINAAASAHEMRAPFALLAPHYRVVALDLLGFGDSDRPQMIYTAELYCDLIVDVARQLGGNVRVIAVSLSSAYVITAAQRAPDAIGAVSVICPTGLEDLVVPSQPGTAYRLLAGPAGAAIFAGLVSRVSMDYFLGQMTYADASRCDAAMRDMYYRVAHRPGARWAPICFVTGLLNCDLRQVLPQLAQPIQIVWGRQASTTPVTRLARFQAVAPHADVHVFAAGMAVQDECPDAYADAVLAFFARD